MGRPRKEPMRTWLGVLTGMVIGIMIISFIVYPAIIDSRLKSLEAAMHSAQQPKICNLPIDSIVDFHIAKRNFFDNLHRCDTMLYVSPGTFVCQKFGDTIYIR